MQREESELNLRGCFFALVGCAVAYALFVLFRHIWPIVPLHCADNWLSLSIGHRGACSHHGGVVGGDTMPWFVKWLAPIGGYAIFGTLSEKLKGYTTVTVGKYGNSNIGKCADTIDKAIQLQSGIEFLYTKKGQPESSRRRVRPIKLFYLKAEIVNTLCVSGYCCTQKDERTFLLARMSQVKLVKLA